jgi:hypothetical protein
MVRDPNLKRLGFFYVYCLPSRASSGSSTLPSVRMPPGVRHVDRPGTCRQWQAHFGVAKRQTLRRVAPGRLEPRGRYWEWLS